MIFHYSDQIIFSSQFLRERDGFNQPEIHACGIITWNTLMLQAQGIKSSGFNVIFVTFLVSTQRKMSSFVTLIIALNKLTLTQSKCISGYVVPIPMQPSSSSTQYLLICTVFTNQAIVSQLATKSLLMQKLARN
jgi:hypothetical protein